MPNKETALKRLGALLVEYVELRKKSNHADLSGGCEDAERKSFATRALSAIMAIAPKDSPYFKQSHNQTTGNHTSIPNLVGILQALKSEVEAGDIRDNEESIQKIENKGAVILDKHFKDITVKQLLEILKNLSLGSWAIIITIVISVFGLGYKSKALKDILIPQKQEAGPLIAENELLRSENKSLKETVAPLLKQAVEKFPGEEINVSLKKVVTLLQKNDPYSQPIRTATATVEVVVASSEDIKTTYMDRGGYIVFAKGRDALIVMASTQCTAIQNGKGEIVYRGIFNMDAAHPANGKPLAFLKESEYVQIGFGPLAQKSKILRGRVICIFNSQERVEIEVPPQEMMEDKILVTKLKGIFPETKTE